MVRGRLRPHGSRCTCCGVLLWQVGSVGVPEAETMREISPEPVEAAPPRFNPSPSGDDAQVGAPAEQHAGRPRMRCRSRL